jgi:hypothetical protein
MVAVHEPSFIGVDSSELLAALCAPRSLHRIPARAAEFKVKTTDLQVL